MEDRITELEIRLALQDELLDTLNATVAQQQLQLTRLQHLLAEMQGHIRLLELGPRNLPQQEIPPHY
ncbi:SlyX family protein [Chitinilyticum piscinae]|uniref:SlyX family protein n=1 Tax=Chitinilyticum piscinae TaxID=2866724 RepID=A0A8J7FKU1_9NEIS|nr:SlyX family protein [Chitinilyticum piscinae]MBE9608279.1 SlyX family protein [Chitinilyticum piscinae]